MFALLLHFKTNAQFYDGLALNPKKKCSVYFWENLNQVICMAFSQKPTVRLPPKLILRTSPNVTFRCICIKMVAQRVGGMGGVFDAHC